MTGVGEIVPSPLPSQIHKNSNCQQKFNVKTNPKNYMAGRVRGPSDQC